MLFIYHINSFSSILCLTYNISHYADNVGDDLMWSNQLNYLYDEFLKYLKQFQLYLIDSFLFPDHIYCMSSCKHSNSFLSYISFGLASYKSRLLPHLYITHSKILNNSCDELYFSQKINLTYPIPL